MFNFNSSWNGSREITPVMVKPNGQKVFWTQLVSDETNRRQVEPDPEPAQAPGWKPALTILLLLVLPMALLIARAMTF
jgi:hypothetical protein